MSLKGVGEVASSWELGFYCDGMFFIFYLSIDWFWVAIPSLVFLEPNVWESINIKGSMADLVERESGNWRVDAGGNELESVLRFSWWFLWA